jgi:hypothetical protein
MYAGESILAVIEAQNIEFNASHAHSTGNILTASGVKFPAKYH